MLTHGELKGWLKYYPKTGKFIWVKGGRKGKEAGHKGVFGCYITILNKRYSARHIAWLYMTGDFPPKDQNIYSISQDPFSVKWSDLSITPAGCRDIGKEVIISRRDTSMHKDNRLGIKGASLHKPSGLYRATVFVNKKAAFTGLL